MSPVAHHILQVPTAGNRLFPSTLKNPNKKFSFLIQRKGEIKEFTLLTFSRLLAMVSAAFPDDLPLKSGESNVVKLKPAPEEREENDFRIGDAPLKYVPLSDVYLATSPRGTASGCKMVKAAASKPPQVNGHDQLKHHEANKIEQFAYVYSRKRKGKDIEVPHVQERDFRGSASQSEGLEVDEVGVERAVKRRRVMSGTELMQSGKDSKTSSKKGDQELSGDGLEKILKNSEGNGNVNRIASTSKIRKRKKDFLDTDLNNSETLRMKKWVRLSFEDVDPEKFVGLQCKVYWPLDASWYSGHIVGYKYETGRHHVKYEDGEEENLILHNERIKFYVSFKEMQSLKLKLCNKSSKADETDVNELMVLAASLDDCQEIETGNVIWAKLTGHAIWPAIVLDESRVIEHKGLRKITGENSVLVQFFGTHDFARVKRKQVISFLKGLLSSFHSKCKKQTFIRGLEEAKTYLSEQMLPERMRQLQDGIGADLNDTDNGEHEDGADSGGECMSHDEIRKRLDDLKNCRLEDGELQIVSLGKIVTDSSNFQNEKFIWPEGYIAVRMFHSLIDPSVHNLYKMEVLRDVDSRCKPLFKVTADNGEEFNGSTPSACWNKIYKKIRMLQIRHRTYRADQNFDSGSSMFGFSIPEVSRLIKEMSNAQSFHKSSRSVCKKIENSSYWSRVTVTWEDLDKCNVCYMDEEYENNLFLQCDKCRMMVHAKCYGELEPTGGILWLCNLCRPGAPEYPVCCLCPIAGGAMKPTTDGRWAHLACAIWIPETCLADIKKMEPIDGLCRIKKDRWKLLCSICNVSHGACIQCSNSNCCVAYHPLCARLAGFCLEAQDMDRLQLAPFDEDEEHQCIQLLSYCDKHGPKSNVRLPCEEQTAEKVLEHPSGCARTEPYSFHKKRKSNKPEVSVALSKRLYLENVPHLPGGLMPHMPLWNKIPSSGPDDSNYTKLQELRLLQLQPSGEILSVADKYNFMRDTFKKRLAFGKSRIHGFGVFAKLRHKAGDMVIEYTGEIIRASVADRREHLVYNKLVGAGTYMFRIDDERVIDATKAGSIANLINHSCEPNCYSRVIKVKDEDHIIIFAKRDIEQMEELTYDYRFFSIGERLACNCGSSRCRGIVNDTSSEERVTKLCVPLSEVKDWKGE